MATAAVRTRPRRTWPQRFLIGFNIVLITCCVAGAGGLLYLYQRFGELPRIEGITDELAPEADDPGEPQNFLLVGSDDRVGEDPEKFGTEAEVGPARTDTIMLVRIDPEAGTAAMLSFPRDLYIPVAGTGPTPDSPPEEWDVTRINEAIRGGPGALIETITQNFNVPINHYAQVDFSGFQRLVDEVGGIEIYLAAPVRDRDDFGGNPSGLDIQETGCVELNGDQALSYVRSRNFQQLIDGEWESDPSGDLGRISRQQDFIRRALREALNEDLLNPIRLNNLVGVAVDNLQISESIDPDDVVSLGDRFASLAPDALQQYTLDVVTRTTDAGASVLDLDPEKEAENEAKLNVFRGVDPEEAARVAPSDVRVQVINGTGRTQEATTATRSLTQADFRTIAPGPDNPSELPTTIVYAEGQRPKAELLARFLEGGADLQEQADLTTTDVLLITGLDYTGVLSRPRAADATTTTTVDEDASTTTTAAADSATLADYVNGVLAAECDG